MKNQGILAPMALIAILLMSGSCTRSERDVPVALDHTKAIRGKSTDLGDGEYARVSQATSSEPENVDVNNGHFKSRTEVDIVSGDFRSNQYRVDSSVKSRIIPSELSKEVRRLGLNTAASPVWKPAYTQSYIAGDIHLGHAIAVNVGNQLVGFLEMTEAADDERRIILAAFMRSLRMETPAQTMNQGYILIEELLERRGLNILDYYPADFARIRAKIRDAANAGKE